MRRKLENHVDELLAFAKLIDDGLIEIAQQMEVDTADVRELFMSEGASCDEQSICAWQEKLKSKIGLKFEVLREAVQELSKFVVRASSAVENINSRLRNYFFLRKQVGNRSLELLRFFLNHRRFPRSSNPDRQGRSPAELLKGENLPHWLELLGFKMFKIAAA